MGRGTDRDEAIATWVILVAMWVIMALPLVFESTPRLEGAHMLAAATAALLFLVMAWRWGLGGLELGEWLLAPTAVALILTLDVQAVGGGGVVSYTALAALLAPVVRHLVRRG